MPTLRSSVTTPALFHILYSESGYGKTTLAAALMALLYKRTGKPAFYYDWDSSAGDIPACVPREAFVVATPNRAAPDRDANDSVLQCKPEKFSAYVVDTTTMLSQAILQSCPPQPTRSGKPSFPYNYSDAQAKFNQWALAMYPLVDAGVHVLWLMHEGFDSDEDASGIVNAIGGPMTKLGAKYLRAVPALSRQIYRMTVTPTANGVTRWLKVESDGVFIAKDRLNAFPDFIRTGVPIGVSPLVAGSDPVAPRYKSADE